MRIEMIYSPDDGGYYAEVFSTNGGATLFTTEVHATRKAARIEAEKFIAWKIDQDKPTHNPEDREDTSGYIRDSFGCY